MTPDQAETVRQIMLASDLAMTLGGGLLTGAIVGLALAQTPAEPALLPGYLVVCLTGLMFCVGGMALGCFAPSLARRQPPGA